MLDEIPIMIYTDSYLNSMIFYKNVHYFYFYLLNYNYLNIFSILPELFLLIICFIILLWTVIKTKKQLYIYNFILIVLCIILNYYIIFLLNYSYFFSYSHFFFLFKNFVLFDYYSFFFKFLIIYLTFVILLVSKKNIYKLQYKILDEFFVLILFSLFFILILFSVNDFFSGYLALEGMSFSLYILASTIYYSKIALEASIKYFILGGIASCIFVNGLSWLFSITNSLDFFFIKFHFLSLENQTNLICEPNLIFILSCFTFTFLFKISAFPCHVWSPDVYEGVWTPITAYFVLVIKTTIFVFFARIFNYVFSDLIILWQPLILISAIGSILIGCFGALLQYRIKRFLAYTSINQVGFLLLGLSTSTINGLTTSFLFLFVYLIMNIIFFIIILNTNHFVHDTKLIFLSDLRSLDYHNSDISILLILTLFSMAGIPPLAGFFTKFCILLHAVSHNFYFITLIILISSLISAYYYLNFIKNMLFEQRRLFIAYQFNYIDIEFKLKYYLHINNWFTQYSILLYTTFFLLFFILIPALSHDLPLTLSLNCKYFLSYDFNNFSL